MEYRKRSHCKVTGILGFLQMSQEFFVDFIKFSPFRLLFVRQLVEGGENKDYKRSQSDEEYGGKPLAFSLYFYAFFVKERALKKKGLLL